MSPRDRILARRAKFVAAAIASAGAVSCGATVCLEPAYDGGADTGKGDAATDTNAEAAVCLAPQIDSGTDTEPMPCLEPPLDSGEPEVCLSAPFDSGAPPSDGG